MKNYKLYYGGEWHDAQAGATFETVNPCNGEVIATLAKGDAEDTKLAIEAAKKAFDSGVWSELDYDDRAAYLLKVADILERRIDEFARTESQDVGKPYGESYYVDIPLSIRAFRFHADSVKSLKGQTIDVPGKLLFDYVSYEPYGVVASIAPWNFPLHLLTRSIGAALAAGNTVVCKAATQTPLTATLLAECFEEAGVPAGVYNVISGPGGSVGEELLANDEVAMVALTGSEAVGRRLMEASSQAKHIKKLSLELGGKSAFIAEPDCDLDGAVNSAILGFCYNQGQVCVSTSRLLLADEIYDEFMDLMLERLSKIVIGDSLAEGTQMGSLVSEEHLQTVQGFVDRAISGGAKLRTGGSRLTGGIYDQGSYYPPTIFEDVTRDMEIFQEEVFGPVLSVTRYQTLDEAIELANATRFALGAAIFSENFRKLYHAAKKVDAGTIWLNCSSKSNIETPFGGNRNSGLGREDGTEGLLEYMKVKNHIMYIAPEYENAYNF
ncbi:MAG: aldehyde dehydrogenase family protein [Clostridiales Family XIII bacterium]|jgi:acyl-CoA reductase-like NAD-dependent aldehyde dehydrogenase|nr:aldehyde dehydrogenase family protein [Clostridiales Family XIII bacterium]